MKRGKKKTCQLGCAKDSACGYCRLHKTLISPKQMKNRECLSKRCRHFIPWKQHPLWETRAKKKETRAKKKETKKEEHAT